ncbi:MAG: hypothetical protein KDA79_16865 [Planctomycetaceae bacterium]|nr:hypothetical protein [Planctomycetaceae bacterium]
MVNLGIIGLGSLWETSYRDALRSLGSRLRVRAVYDTVHARAQQVATELEADAAGGVLALAGRCDVQAILVLDAGWILPAALPMLAATGKPLLVAGDPAENAPWLRQLQEDAMKRGQTIVPALDLRYAPSTFRLQELMATRLGRPQEVDLRLSLSSVMLSPASSARPGRSLAPAASGSPDAGSGGAAAASVATDRLSLLLNSGRLMSIADWCRYLLRTPPAEMDAQLITARETSAAADKRSRRDKSASETKAAETEEGTDDEGDVELHIRYTAPRGSSRGARVSIRLVCAEGPAGQSAESRPAGGANSQRALPLLPDGCSYHARITCERGSAVISGSHQIHWSSMDDNSTETEEDLRDDQPGQVVMLDHFCRRVVGGLIPVASIQDVCRSVQFVEAATSSLSTGSAVSFDQEH